MCIYVFAHSAAGCMYKNACRLPVNLPEISRVSDVAQFVLWPTKPARQKERKKKRVGKRNEVIRRKR